MPKILYREMRLGPKRRKMVEQANTIIEEYAAQGFDLTLRQLYYQFVSRDLLANTPLEYKRLGELIADARLAGLVDWSAISDRTRNLRGLSHFNDPADVVLTAAYSYRNDKWAEQKVRPEVWIEKDALVGVIAGVCNELDVPFFSCRGYTSLSEMWSAGQRLARYADAGQEPTIFHFGDHDPSGIDMSRDIQDRLAMFCGQRITFRRLALNMDQVEQYNPPPNPAKMTDSRCYEYVKKFGALSWELDALEPTVLAALIRDAVTNERDEEVWQNAVDAENEGREGLKKAAALWPSVARYLAKCR